ncbi:MAG: phage antirepressor N-terminal domain-containing protein [Tannerellaceae bacterium]|jgi:hypothetical protein|nr:phage antirepressor N-terminal domain-containing protein [Tannerellaceae bacterium]
MEIKGCKTLARINDVAIQLVENNGEKWVPVKPICDALGVDFSAQRQRIERDKLLSSTVGMITTVAADEKEREMFCISFKFVFGWLFTIDTDRVKEEAQEAVVKYQLQCYNALYDYFTSRSEFVEQKQIEIDRQLEVVETAKAHFSDAKNVLSKAESRLKQLRNLTMDDFDMEHRQLKINFAE